MPSQQQIDFVKSWIETSLIDEVYEMFRDMRENDDDEVLDGLTAYDFFVSFDVTVKSHLLVSWPLLLSTLKKQDYNAFRTFEDYHLVDGLNSDPYKRIIEIHSRVDDTNSLFHDALVKAAKAVAGSNNRLSRYKVYFTEEGAKVRL